MGRHIKPNRNISVCISLEPLSIKEIDKFINESRSQFIRDAINNELKRRKME